MSEELWMTCQRNPQWAAAEITHLKRRVAEVEADINIIYVAVVKYVEDATAMIAALKELHDA